MLQAVRMEATVATLANVMSGERRANMVERQRLQLRLQEETRLRVAAESAVRLRYM